MKQLGLGRAWARAALVGNPSDLDGGAVLAVTVPAFAARASAEAAARDEIEIDPPSDLVAATVRRFGREIHRAALCARVRWNTSIPEGVGLGGSSALVIAVTRALCQLSAAAMAPHHLAEFALAVEVEDLGITAGLQDRVAQAFEGLTFMEFGPGGRYEALDPALLPSLLVAWRADAAGHSGRVHDRLTEREDPTVRVVMQELADSAREARSALLAGDGPGFAACVDRSFDLRGRLLELDPRCVAMIDTARAAGCAANYTGSGGAIVAVCQTAGRVEAVAAALEAEGCGVCLINKERGRDQRTSPA